MPLGREVRVGFTLVYTANRLYLRLDVFPGIGATKGDRADSWTDLQGLH